MVYDIENDYISDEAFTDIYNQIYQFYTSGKKPSLIKHAIILGGQPGAGKSTFYQHKNLNDYISINGDEYRKFHPHYKEIVKTDIEHYAERTQKFSNRIAEKLIENLCAEGYNLIIEGTLRDPNVPIKTCNFLKQFGYSSDLVVVACNAVVAWNATINRAYEQIKNEMPGRLVPLDIFDYTVKNICQNLSIIENENCFSKIIIIERDGNILYPNGEKTASNILTGIIDLNGWEKEYDKIASDFIKTKIEFMKHELEGFNNEEHN